ncbi:MAG: PilZ domain-containing protein [Planctomycetota bacterium]
MAFLSLQRRRTQLELLAEVCARRAPVRITSAPWAAQRGLARTRFAALEPNGILVDWPVAGVGSIPVSGATVDLYFEHAGLGLGCRTDTLGRAWSMCERRGQVPVWKLAVPLCIEPTQQRRHYRVDLSDLAPLPARCTSTRDPRLSFVTDIQNLSAGGLLGRASGPAGRAARCGDVLWTEFDLPGEPTPFEFVVRVVHVRPARQGTATDLGCMFCPSDDPTRHRRELERIEHFVARRERAQIRRAKAEGDE